MFSKLTEGLLNPFSKSGKHYRLIQVAIFVAITLPVIFVTTFAYLSTKNQLTELVISRRESIAYLAAINLEEKFHRLTDLGVSFATRVQFRKLIQEGKWDEAVQILKNVPTDFPSIERLFLVDPSGIRMADTPPDERLKGKDFSYRDWYKGVTKSGKPYLSEVYKRASEPQYNVAAISTPIKANDQSLMGILVMQVRLETFLGWSQEVEGGPSGFAYFVDQRGHIAAHPKYPPQGEIIDFSSDPAVQKALQVKKGVEVLYNPIEKEERLVAYHPVSTYGWAVVVQQPTVIAFAARESRLQETLLLGGILLLLVSFLAFFILRFIDTLHMLRQKEKVFLESVGDGLAAIDRAWHITLWNKAATLLSGWSQKEALGKPLREILKFIAEKDQKENITFIEETMLYGKPHPMENDTFLVRKDGSKIYVGDTAAPIFNGRGEVAGAIIVFRDISKERELRKVREEFQSLAAHQLRAPLTAIGGFLEMLQDEKAKLSPQERTFTYEKLNEANERMLALVNGFLNVSRIELGTLAIEPQLTFLPDLADKVLGEFLPQIQKKKLTLKKDYGKALPAINVDPSLMRAILSNLLSNAVKYTPEEGTIGIALEKKDAEMLIKVWDTGYGIPKEQQSKIFTKLFRADNIQKIDPQGTGLGLYIVKSVLDQAGGKIWFESEEGKGTTFYVTVPLTGMKKKEGIKGLT